MWKIVPPDSKESLWVEKNPVEEIDALHEQIGALKEQVRHLTSDRSRLEFEDGPGGTVIKNLKEHLLSPFHVAELEERIKALEAENAGLKKWEGDTIRVYVKCAKCGNGEDWVCAECYQDLEARLYDANHRIIELEESVKGGPPC